MPDKIEVLIVDDHQKLRRGIIALLAHAEDIRIVGEASTGAEAIALVKRNPPHVVLIDLQMPEVDGIEATIAIKNNWPQVKVITMTWSTNHREAALAAGTDYFLLKGDPNESLTNIIHDVFHKRMVSGSPE